jgi:hypothetical protein
MGQMDLSEEEPLSDLEQFWANIFSGEAPLIKAAWATLTVEERAAVRAHLLRIQADPERLAEQREAAAIALRVIAEH